jgi:hypothetical protein
MYFLSKEKQDKLSTAKEGLTDIERDTFNAVVHLQEAFSLMAKVYENCQKDEMNFDKKAPFPSGLDFDNFMQLWKYNDMADLKQVSENELELMCDNIIQIKEKSLEKIMDEAQDAFWSVLGKKFPNVSGDFGPLEQHNFDIECMKAIKHWLEKE